jgi:multiple sugar transport system substrate-binding protein
LTDGGVNQTPDEIAFQQQLAPYYIKYQNAPMRFAATWEDPTNLQMAALPVQEGGAGGTVFWDTGACLFTHGLNKQAAADYMTALTTDAFIWQESIAGDEANGVPPVGQIPVYNSVWEEFTATPPEWLSANEWAISVWEALPQASAIAPSKLSVTQFNVAAPFYSAYLRGDEADAKTAMTKAYDAVQAEFAK